MLGGAEAPENEDQMRETAGPEGDGGEMDHVGEASPPGSHDARVAL